MHHLILVVLLSCFSGCKSDKTPVVGQEPPSPRPTTSDAREPMASPVMLNLLPPELEGLAIGMSVDRLRAARKASALRVTSAHHYLEGNALTGNENNDELTTKLDSMSKHRRKVEAADWPGMEGLYYLEETFEKSPIQRASYMFRDSELRRVIVYYATPEQAKEASRILLGKEYTTKKRWLSPAGDGTPVLSGWVFKDRYVLAAAPSTRGIDKMDNAGTPKDAAPK